MAHLLTRFGPKQVLLTDSGTSALALALRLAVDLRPDRPQVALPAWACYDLATAADAADVGVVLYDIDPTTLGPEWGSLERALAVGVAAVVVVHAYGLPVNFPEVEERAHLAGALIVEDAAQAIGSTVNGRPAGSVGGLGVLSFGRGKGWTGGGGGALLLNPSAPAGLTLPDPASLAAGGRGLGAAVKLTAQWLLARPGAYAIPSALPFLRLGQTLYHAATPPARVSGFQAGVLLGTAPSQEDEAGRRRDHARRLGQAILSTQTGRVPAPWNGGVPGWLRLPILPADALFRRVDAPAARRLGVMPAYPQPLIELPGFSARLRGGDTRHPGAEELVVRLRTLPTHSLLTEGDLQRLESWLGAR
jgi:dTDP-4-amino-4,6-dideoxygalactose transaminase